MQSLKYYEDSQLNTDHPIDGTLNGIRSGGTMRLRMRLIWTLVFFGPATYLLVQHDYVAAAIVSAAGFAAFAGYRTGMFSMFSSMMAITAAIAFAPQIGMENAYRFTQWFGTTGLANRFLSIGVIGLAIATFVMACLWFILGRMVRRRRSLDRANRSLGFALGAAQGVLCLVFFIGGLLVMEPIETQRAELRDPDDARGRFVSKLVLSTAQATRQSCLGPTLIKYNPLTMIPQLNKIEEFGRTAEVLSDPVKMKNLLDEPEIQSLRQKPIVQKLITELTSDPAVQEMLSSGQPMSPAMAMKLLNHPAVMDLIDQPGFLEEAAKAIQNAVPKTGLVH